MSMPDTSPIELVEAFPTSPYLPGTHIQYAWDSTSIGDLRTCPRLYYYRIVCGYRTKEESVHLRFGGEFHKAQEDFFAARAEGESHEDAVRETVAYTIQRIEGWEPDQTTKAGKYKNPSSLVQTIINYFDHYRHDPAKIHTLRSGKPATELSFRFSLDWGPKQRECNVCGGSGFSGQGTGYDDVCGECGGQKLATPQPYLLCGHLDRVVEYAGGLFVLDYKTTASSLSDYYFAQFDPNPQMTLYSMAAKVIMEQSVKGVIVEGVQILLEPPFNNFQRHFTYRNPARFDEWLTDLGLDLRRAEGYAIDHYWPQNDTACNRYGGCEFREVCTKAPHVRESLLKTKFNQLLEDERWNPLRAR